MRQPIADLLLELVAEWRSLEGGSWADAATQLEEVATVLGSFITAGELAKLKNVSASAVYQWARDGKIDTYELGGRLFFLDGEVK
jgi:excisionase family DNA binding protein